MIKKHTFSLLAGLLLVLTLFLIKQPVSAAENQNEQIKAIQKRGVIKIGVKQDVPNFGYYSAKSNTYEGMEIDIARKIADSLQVKIEFVPVTTQTREAVMDNGQVDIVIATYTVTPARQKSYNFSNPYYVDEVGFLVNKSSKIKTIQDLDGLTIGVSQGATTKNSIEEYGKAHNLSFKFVQLGSFPELSLSLYAKRIQAFSVDKSILSGYRSKQTEILQEGFNSQDYGIASKKSNTELISYINQLLSEWKTDGSLQTIYDKYNLKPADAENK